MEFRGDVEEAAKAALRALAEVVRSTHETLGQLERIEEIEGVLYQAGRVPLDELDFDEVRRTYAFFEASAWLVDHYLPPSLIH